MLRGLLAAHRLAVPHRGLRVATTFFLQQHVFLCRADRHWVVLDVARDKYLCVDRHQFESLGPWLHGWERTAEHGVRHVPEAPDDAIALAKELVAVDILSERADGAKDARPTSLMPPTDALDVEFSVPSRGSSWIHAFGFFLSSARASRQLRNQPFQSIISSVRARKHRNRRSGSPFDVERARSLIAAFDALRLFYPRPYLCLFDSLALVHFLARYGLFPEWVFGVTAEPFEAHCWVQEGSTALNDTLERVSAFTPIMHL
jgi:hypothetical protein